MDWNWGGLTIGLFAVNSVDVDSELLSVDLSDLSFLALV